MKIRSFLVTFLSLLVFAVTLIFIVKIKYSVVLVIVAALWIHEAGHYLAFRKYKVEGLHIIFIPFLGAITTGFQNVRMLSERQFVIVLLAGPFLGLLSLIPFLIYRETTAFEVRNWIAHYIIGASIINGLNLLPVFPLDGGRTVKILLNLKGRKYFWFLVGSVIPVITYGFWERDYFSFVFVFILLLLIYQEHLTKSERWPLFRKKGWPPPPPPPSDEKELVEDVQLSGPQAIVIELDINSENPNSVNNVSSLYNKSPNLKLTKTERYLFFILWLALLFFSIYSYYLISR